MLISSRNILWTERQKLTKDMPVKKIDIIFRCSPGTVLYLFCCFLGLLVTMHGSIFFCWKVPCQLLYFFIITQKVGKNVNVSNQIETDTGFYYQRLSEFPAKLATIEYTITFNKTNIELNCVNGTRCILRLDIYTREDGQNLMTNCSSNGYGQLRNENLNTLLRNRGKPYRFTTCKSDNVDSDFLHCKGRTVIQNVVPRKYGFSIGYHCKAVLRPSLRGLFFNFTI